MHLFKMDPIAPTFRWGQVIEVVKFQSLFSMTWRGDMAWQVKDENYLSYSESNQQ